MEEALSGKKSKWKWLIKRIFQLILLLIGLIVILVFMLNLPSIQTLITNKITTIIEQKTGTVFKVKSLKIAFPKTIDLSEVYILDQQKDTLLYLNSLKINVDLIKLLKKEIQVNTLSLENMVGNVYINESTQEFNFQYIIDVFAAKDTSKPLDTLTKKNISWAIDIKHISLKNINASYKDKFNGLDLTVSLGAFEFAVNEFNLNEKIVALDEITLNNSSVKLVLSPKLLSENSTNILSDSILLDSTINQQPSVIDFFPDWNFSAKDIVFENIHFIMDNEAQEKLAVGMDYNHLNLNNINLLAKDIVYNKEGIEAKIKQLDFEEQCGFNMERLTVDAKFKTKQLEAKNLQLKTSNSSLSASANLHYASVDEFFKKGWNNASKFEIVNAKIDPNDIFYFAPELESNELISNYLDGNIFVSAKAEGTFDRLNFKSISLDFWQNATIKASGTISGLPNIDNFGYDLLVDHLQFTKKNVYRIVDPKLISNIQIPDLYKLSGSLKGNLNAIETDINLYSAFGNIYATGFYKSNRTPQKDTLSLSFELNKIHVGKILTDTLIGKADVSGTISLSGINSDKINGDVTVKIQSAEYNRYTYNNILLTSSLNNDILTSSLVSNDPNLKFKLDGNADLSNKNQQYNAQLDISKLRLMPLNFSSEDISISTYVNAYLSYADIEHAHATISLVNTYISNQKLSFPFKKLNISAQSLNKNSKIQIESDLIDGFIEGNMSLIEIPGNILNAFNTYLGVSDITKIQSDDHFSFKADIHLPKEFVDIFIPELTVLKISQFDGKYSSLNNSLLLNMDIPKLVYSSIELDSFQLELNGHNTELQFDLLIDEIRYDTLNIQNIGIKQKLSFGELLSEFSISDSLNNPSYLFANVIVIKDDYLKVKFLPEGLILDGKTWKVDTSNYFENNKGLVFAQNTKCTFEDQLLQLTIDDGYPKLSFTNFGLENITNIITSENTRKIIKGIINGEITLPNKEKPDYLETTIAISNLQLIDIPVGDLELNFKSDNDDISLSSKIKNESNNLFLKGLITSYSKTPQLDIQVDLDINDLKRLEAYSMGYLSEMDGKIDGKLSIQGLVEKPEISGLIKFENVATRVNSLNFVAKIKDEKITLNSESIHFDNFKIEDEQSKQLVINGDILINKLDDLGINMDIRAENFMPINSTASINPVFYGKLAVDFDVNLKGPIMNPKIIAGIDIKKATDLSYVLPSSDLQLVNSEGIVQFIDPNKPIDSAQINAAGDYFTDSIISSLKRLDYSVNLNVDPDAKFTIHIDKKSGDYLTIGGSANLTLTDDGTGNQSITGVYKVKSGVYQLAFYGLVKKTFMIEEGSMVSWSGKPMDADLHISATHIVRTSSVALVANETGSMSDAEKTLFNQRLPYEVKLNISGFLAQPDFGFKINLPEKYLAINPVVASKLAILNTEENTSERNKQVFALLVTGSFIAENPAASTGSSPTNIATTAARNSVNGILADQMNKLSSRFINNVDVNFGLTSYENFEDGSSDMRTELDVQVSKNLFNDRIKVEAMSSFDVSNEKTKSTNTSENTTGEYAVIYTITPTGEYKLRLYHQNTYDLFDGEIAISGIAVSFEKEYDSLKRNKKNNKNRGENKRKEQGIKSESPEVKID